MCTGNTDRGYNADLINPGLSLCVQGTPNANSCSGEKIRFIPVCTGNTADKLVADIEAAVYPCVYREHLCQIFYSNTEHGLSLCVQGTQQLRILMRTSTRFIPVCTGNTLVTSAEMVYTPVYPCVYREHLIGQQG